jgi:hypothetical protein
MISKVNLLSYSFKIFISYLFLLLILTACSSGSNKKLDNIEEIKKDFIATILTESVLDEGPFQMNYHLRAILFSDNVVSLMGDVLVFAHLPKDGLAMKVKRMSKPMALSKKSH